MSCIVGISIGCNDSENKGLHYKTGLISASLSTQAFFLRKSKLHYVLRDVFIQTSHKQL